MQGVTQTPAVQVKYDLDASSLGLRLPADDLGCHQTHLEHVDGGPVLWVPLADPVDEHPAAGVVPCWQNSMVGGVEEAEYRRRRQRGADIRTLLPPLLVVE